MNTHNCLFKVSLFKDDHHLLNFAWTDDKDAVIEAMDEINQRRCRDLRYKIMEHDHRRGVLILIKNGHILLTTDPFTIKPFNEKIDLSLTLINRSDQSLRASVITRGSGGVSLPVGITLGEHHVKE